MVLTDFVVLFQYLVPHNISGSIHQAVLPRSSHGRHLCMTDDYTNRVRLMAERRLSKLDVARNNL
jgi:hypothetical protein